MSGRMRTRGKLLSEGVQQSFGMAKSFHAPQKDSSLRRKKGAKLNDYTDQSHQVPGNAEAVQPTKKRKRRSKKKKHGR